MGRHPRTAFSSRASGKAMHAAFDGGRLTSDAGVLMLAWIERRLGIAERLARCPTDLWASGRVRRTIVEMIRFRVLLIAAGYPGANDCGALRSDPAFKMAIGRSPESGADLCSQPTPDGMEVVLLLRHIIRIRARWPKVDVLVRGTATTAGQRR